MCHNGALESSLGVGSVFEGVSPRSTANEIVWAGVSTNIFPVPPRAVQQRRAHAQSDIKSPSDDGVPKVQNY